MNTYFIRHNSQLDISDEMRQRLWNEKIIAIHFPQDQSGNLIDVDNSSLEPTDYAPNGRSALMIFKEIAKFGGYVFAEYLNGCVVGKIEPKSDIFLFTGLWGNN